MLKELIADKSRTTWNLVLWLITVLLSPHIGCMVSNQAANVCSSLLIIFLSVHILMLDHHHDFPEKIKVGLGSISMYLRTSLLVGSAAAVDKWVLFPNTLIFPDTHTTSYSPLPALVCATVWQQHNRSILQFIMKLWIFSSMAYKLIIVKTPLHLAFKLLMRHTDTQHQLDTSEIL